MIRPIDNFVKVETCGNFSLWINKPIYKIYKTTSGFIQNTKTGLLMLNDEVFADLVNNGVVKKLEPNPWKTDSVVVALKSIGIITVRGKSKITLKWEAEI